MKKIVDAVKKDAWVVLLDVVSVNASYYLALLIRFYVNFTLRPVAVDRYLPAWIGFAPWYTVACLVVFGCFRLYGGMWRYAGINSMNRIVLANAMTTVVHVLGTSIFFTRMPITYYTIGALLQFGMVVCIRFGYRVFLVEKKRLRRGQKITAVVIGDGENGRRVLKHLEDAGVYRVVGIVGQGSGIMDGVPVRSLDELDLNSVRTVFIANPLLPTEQRKRIKGLCESAGVDLLDYTGFFSNLGGRLSLTELLSTIHGSVSIELDGKERVFTDGAAALAALTGKYMVKQIDGDNMKITIQKAERPNREEALRAAYAAVSGT